MHLTALSHTVVFVSVSLSTLKIPSDFVFMKMLRIKLPILLQYIFVYFFIQYKKLTCKMAAICFIGLH